MYIEYDGYVVEPDPEYNPPPPEETYHYYNTDYNVFARVLEPYLHGDLTFNEARKKLIRSSPLVWPGYMENVQVHHGVQDTLGRYTQTEAWKDIFEQVEYAYEFHLYPLANHTIGNNDYDPEWGENYKAATEGWLKRIIDVD